MTIRCSVLFAVLLAALVGCGKPSPTSTGDAPGGSGEAHAIKIREKQAGEKYEVTQTAVRSELTFKGDAKDAAPGVEKVTTKAAYTEEVETMDGAAVAKGKRTYTVAEGASFGKAAPLSFVGKTIAFESKGGKTTFALADGKPVAPGADTFALQDDFERNKVKGVAQLIPDSAVKVGESWDVPADKLAAVFGPMAQAAQMKGTGKLEKAAKKDGKLYGVVTIKLTTQLGDKDGKDSLEWSYDGCIDGSVTDGTRKSVQTMRAPAGPGGALPEMVNTTETTIKPAK